MTLSSSLIDGMFVSSEDDLELCLGSDFIRFGEYGNDKFYAEVFRCEGTNHYYMDVVTPARVWYSGIPVRSIKEAYKYFLLLSSGDTTIGELAFCISVGDCVTRACPVGYDALYAIDCSRAFNLYIASVVATKK